MVDHYLQYADGLPCVIKIPVSSPENRTLMKRSPIPPPSPQHQNPSPLVLPNRPPRPSVRKVLSDFFFTNNVLVHQRERSSVNTSYFKYFFFFFFGFLKNKITLEIFFLNSKIIELKSEKKFNQTIFLV